MRRSMTRTVTLNTMSGKSSKWFYRGFKQTLKGRCEPRTRAGAGRYDAAWRTVNTTLRNRTRTVVVSCGRKCSGLRTGSSAPHPRACPAPPSKSSTVLLVKNLVMLMWLELMLSTHGRRNVSYPPHRLVNQEIRHHLGLLL